MACLNAVSTALRQAFLYRYVSFRQNPYLVPSAYYPTSYNIPKAIPSMRLDCMHTASSTLVPDFPNPIRLPISTVHHRRRPPELGSTLRHPRQ